MNLYPIELFENKKIGQDKLHNPIYELSSFYVGEGRKSIWTATEISLDNRIVSKQLQKAVTTLCRSRLEQAVCLELNGDQYSIEEIKGEDDDRWRIVYLKSYGK